MANLCAWQTSYTSARLLVPPLPRSCSSRRSEESAAKLQRRETVKRKTNAAAVAAEAHAKTVAAVHRAVRQCTEQLHSAGQTATATLLAAAASSSLSSALAAVSYFLRLAVVERQLVMQCLDLRSLARLASACKQMRRESLSKEVGKFINDLCGIPYRALSINGHHSAHDSPLFRKHAPMTLRCRGFRNAESLMQKATQFSRIGSFEADDSFAWTEKQMQRQRLHALH